MTPKVSVLLPVRDAGKTLGEALRSIRNQTLRDWEIIAVNDGSRDDSGEILERHAADDSRLRTIHLSSPSGIVAALELARARATAPLLARMDADDRAAPSRLAEQAAFLERHPEIALCGTHVRYFPRAILRAGALRYEAWLNGHGSPSDLARDLWVECPIAHPSFLLRADVLEAVAGYCDMGWPEDYDLVLRLWAAGHGIGVVPKVLLHWREGSGRLSRTDARYSASAFREAKLYYLRETLLRDRDGMVVWGAGPIGKAFATTALVRQVPVHAFVDLNPRKIGQEIHGAPVVRPEDARRFRASLHVAAVGQPGVREEIRNLFHTWKECAGGRSGWEEGRNFIAIA